MVNYPQGRGGRNLGSGGSSSVGAISYDAGKIKNAFFSRCSARRAQQISGDGGYWTGGRCDWGAGHNLDEDINKLVSTFNKVADMSGAIASLKECSSANEFSAHKSALLAKCNQAIAEMNLGAIESNIGYRDSLCIIWTDYTATFLTPYITAFTNDLNRQMQEINSLNYEELVKLEALQLEEQKINKDIEEAYQKYNETTDPDEQANILMAIRSLKQKHEAVVSKIMANPWNKVGEYDYTQGINNIIEALERGKGNNPPPNNRFPNPSGQGQGSGKDGNGGGSGNTNLPPNLPNNPWNPNQPKDSGQLDQQTLMIIAGAGLLVVFLMMNQKEKPNHKDYYEDYY